MCSSFVISACRLFRTLLVVGLAIMVVSYIHLSLKPVHVISKWANQLQQQHIANGKAEGEKVAPATSQRAPTSTHDPPVNWTDKSFCTTTCKTGTPCEYKDEVDFRIMVITYNRAHSTQNCLEAIAKVDTLGLKVAVEIWIDSKAKDKEDVDAETLKVAETFANTWKGGRACVHKQNRNALIIGQWIDTWRPRNNTKEIGVFVEDDVDVSYHALRWLKLVHEKYGGEKDLAGFSLQMEEESRFFAGKQGQLVGPKDQNVFLYRVLGTWGFSPQPKPWREFQNWFHTKDAKLKPYVNGIVPTSWYRSFEKQHREQHMWSMWHIYYTDMKKQYTMYCNLHRKMGKKDIKLASNRREKGLHYQRGGKTTPAPTKIRWNTMMTQWKEEYAQFPQKLTRYAYDGKVV